MRASALALLLLGAGCSTQSDAINVSGQVSLDGISTPAEVLIEPLPQEDRTTLSPVTTFAGSDGSFAVSMAGEAPSTGPIPCRVVIRVSTPLNSDVPASLNEQAPPDRVVTLHRDLRDGQTLSLLLTH